MPACKLCGDDKQLQLSHFMPASAYRQMAKPDDDLGGAIKIDFDSNVAFATSKQEKKHLLCCECEQLFSRYGENGVSKLWAKEGGFPLLELLQSDYTGSLDIPPNCTYFTAQRLTLSDLKSVIYFAASIIWRAHHWPGINGDSGSCAGCLGKRYEGQFKNFLLSGGESELTAHFSILANSNYATHQVLTFPRVVKTQPGCLYAFEVPGIRILVQVGQHTKKIRPSTRGLPAIFAVFDMTKDSTFEAIALKVQRGILLKGKLKSWSGSRHG